MLSSSWHHEGTSPLDEAQLRKRCCGVERLVERVLQQFRQTLVEELPTFRASAAPVDPADLAKRAHRLKGAALNVSAHRFAGLLAQLEQAALENDRAAVEPLLALVQHEGEQLVQYLDRNWPTQSEAAPAKPTGQGSS
ncbi:MAG: hypothetical protein KatS3mg110_3416 [Pirellulaceae bacterium]|nr:MAG: hypothetical protein KatS3mg110_3416 [Pirellulaceae bacterium]